MNEKITEYDKIIILVYKCIFGKKLKDRIKYGKRILKEIEKSKKNSEKIYTMFYDMADKLTNASTIIKTQDELISNLTSNHHK